MRAYREENRVLVCEYLTSHPRVDCGETDLIVLDFDHRDPTSKRSEVARLVNSRPWAQVIAEIAKCDVRCANCHRRRTAQQFEWGKRKRQHRLPERPLEPSLRVTLPAPDQIWASSLDGETRRCSVCGGVMQPITEFALKDKRRGLRSTKCRTCQAAYSREHYRRNRARYLHRARARQVKNRENCRQLAFEYLLTHPCVDCGEADPIVLEFDHRDESHKRGTISRMLSQFSWCVVAEEIAKCDVRCANCHRRRTAKQFGWAKLQEHAL